MHEVVKEYAGDSGPNWVVDLEGPDGNVFALWGMLERFIDEDAIEDSKIGGHYANPDDCPYEGYERVLDYCLHYLAPSPPGIEFRVHGTEITSIPEYREFCGYDSELDEYKPLNGG